MANKFFATFPSGAQQIVFNRLSQYPAAQLKVHDTFDGLVVFSSELNTNQLSELRFFNNVYRLLADLGEYQSIDQAASQLIDVEYHDIPTGNFKVGARLMSQTVGLADLSSIQKDIAKKTKSSAQAHRAQVEYLLLMRDDGHAYWGYKLASVGFKKRSLEPGELKPQIAHIMGLLAGANQRQAVLDPFAGYGAIVRECLQGFHCQKVIAVELNEHLLPHLKSIPNLIAEQGDASKLERIQPRTIDRIITDPPWGEYAEYSLSDLEELYYGAIRQMHRVLRAKGVAVILSSYPRLADLARQCGFDIERKYSLLISGKKAKLYKLRRLANSTPAPINRDYH